MKATYRGCVHDGWEHTELIYEYRGFTYVVTKHNNGYMDKSLRQQHQEEQAKIDYKIAHKDDPIPEYNNDAEKAFDELLAYFDQE